MVTLRPLTTADIPAHAALLAAAEAADDTGEHYNEPDLVEEYANPDVEVGHDIVGAFDDDDATLVGYAAVYPRVATGSHLTLHLEGTVHPDHRGRGTGTALTDDLLRRARVVHTRRAPELPARLRLSGLTRNTAQHDLLVAAGLLPHRWNSALRVRLRDLDLDAPAPPLPVGHTLLAHRPDLDAAMHAAHNEAFLDHPDFTPWSEQVWRQWVSGSRNFRPDLSLLLVADDRPDRVVAYVQSNEFDAYAEATGRREAYVAKVGVRRDLRRRGVAAALLHEALRRYRAAGFDEAALDVDTENPTGALGVYERAGFRVERRWTTYAAEWPPATA